jgi:hypothetical protein
MAMESPDRGSDKGGEAILVGSKMGGGGGWRKAVIFTRDPSRLIYTSKISYSHHSPLAYPGLVFPGNHNPTHLSFLLSGPSTEYKNESFIFYAIPNQPRSIDS